MISPSVIVSVFAFTVILFLTLRDICIFRATRVVSYRRGALRGLFASSIALFGLMLTESPDSQDMGLLLSFIAVFLNKKGVREDVFTHNETAFQRFIGAVSDDSDTRKGD
ncbi:MAG: hypothetical protein ACXQTM_03400 [Methanosarcinales archaeon]